MPILSNPLYITFLLAHDKWCACYLIDYIVQPMTEENPSLYGIEHLYFRKETSFNSQIDLLERRVLDIKD